MLRQLGDGAIVPDCRHRHLRLERRAVLLPCPLHVLLPRYPRFLGAGLHLSYLSHFRGPAQGEQWQEIGAAKAGDVEGGTLQGGKQGLFGVAEEIETSEGEGVDGTRLGETVERSDAGGEVVETGEVFEVAAVAPEQDVREGGEAVDVLFDGSKGVACWTLLMFYLAVVLEGGDV